MFDYVVFTILIRFIDLKKFEKLKQKLEEFDFVVVIEFVVEFVIEFEALVVEELVSL